MVERDEACQQRARDHQTDAGDIEELINQELGRQLILRDPRASRGHQVEELS